MSDSIIWMLLIFTFLIIIGLYASEYTPINLDEKEKILKLNYVTEHFSPLVSTTVSQTEGASELYDWGVPDNTVYTEPAACEHECTDTCEPQCEQKCPPPPVQQSCPPPPRNLPPACGNCDITQNKDIDKYVLKSSVPACPDMADYITKNMMNAHPDLKDYILKSEIKPCEKMDISQYILKSEIPACPTCPICPTCPTCPICPAPQKKCKEIHEYKITDHPDMKNYVHKSQINSYSRSNDIKEDQIKFKSAQYKNFINNVYEESDAPQDTIGYYAGDNLYAGV